MIEEQVRACLERAFIAFSDKPGKNNSIQYLAVNCPYCNDRSKHGGFKKTTGSYHCFKCGENKTLYRYLVDQLGKDQTIQIFIEVGLFDKVKINPEKEDEIEKYIESLLKEEVIVKRIEKEEYKQGIYTPIPKEAIPFLKEPRAVDYLVRERKIPFTLLKKLEELCSPLWFPEIKDKRFDSKFRWAMQNRIAFPITVDSEVISWSARDVTSESKIRYLTPKPEYCRQVTQRLIFPFDYLSSIKGKLLLLQEGIFDIIPFLLTGNRTGVYSCSIFKNDITPEQIELLTRIAPNFEKVLIVLDREEEAQSLKVFTALSPHIPNLVSFYCPTKVKDTGEIPFSAIPKVAEFLIKYSEE